MSQKKPKKRKEKLKKEKVLDSSKQFFIFLGTIFIIYGLLIGEIHISEYHLPYYYPIILGLILQVISILIFVKQKQIKI